MKRLAAALLAAFAFHAAAQQLPPDRAQVEKRLASVETLIERSSAARQIESSRVPGAVERREKARASLKGAREAYAAGDLAKASTLLPEASMLMFEAVKLAAPEQVTAAKRRTDVEERLASARALAAAQRRVAVEKPSANTAETAQAIDALLKRGEALLAANDVDGASTAVEQGYLLAKAAIGSMRSGDTLVRTLSFKSKEEEYAYELDRNDTHRMLLGMLVDAAKSERVKPSLDQSNLLRAQAEGAAKAGDHGAAIRMLEDSTRELVRAIRAAGIYIPG